MRSFGHVAQITPYPFAHCGEDVPIGRQASHQEGALDAGQNLRSYIAGALITDSELALFHTIANHLFKPIDMHLGKSVQTRLHRRRDGAEDCGEGPTGTHTLALAMNLAERIKIGFETLLGQPE
jgi:hypothetical protein